MASYTTSYWYDSSNDVYEIPVVLLGDISDVPNQDNPLSCAQTYSSTYSFKGKTGADHPANFSREITIIGALGRRGNFYPSSDQISSNNQFGVWENANIPGKYEYYADTTGVYNVAHITENVDTNARIDTYLALATIDDKDYLGIYMTGAGLSGGGYSSAWVFCYNTQPEQAWNVYKQYLSIDPPPGKPGYKPTGTKYDWRHKPGVGGRGHKTDPGNNPGYNTDTIENPGAPNESYASAIGSGLIKSYKINTANLANLSTCLYGTTLGGLITNLAINPLDFIISLNIFPYTPSVGTSTNVVLGKWVCTDSGVDSLGGNVLGSPITSQYKVIHFGHVDIQEQWGSFLDYTHTTIELYLPFIGVVDVDTAEVMEGGIDLDYTIDFLTGMCVANVNCNRTVELPDGRVKNQKSQHSYQGNCAMNIPLSQQQYGNMIGSIINAGVSGMKAGLPGVGISVASDVASGGFKPSVTTKGSITANAGYCSVLYPYIRITRPISAVSDSYQETVGYPSYIDSTLGDCDDYCVCDSIDLRSITGATASEIERIRQMCMEGVHV